MSPPGRGRALSGCLGRRAGRTQRSAGRRKPPQASRLLAAFTRRPLPPGGLNLFGTVTAWTGRICPPRRLSSGSPARFSRDPSCSSTMPPSTPPRLCPLFWRPCSRRATPLCPSPSSSSPAPAAQTTPSTIPAGSVPPESCLGARPEARPGGKMCSGPSPFEQGEGPGTRQMNFPLGGAGPLPLFLKSYHLRQKALPADITVRRPSA